jgi:thiamine kinase-like enzyme
MDARLAAQTVGKWLSNFIRRGARLDGVCSALARIPLFKDVRPEAVKLEPLDSLTNATYKVTTGGLAYTLRLPGKDTYEYVDRVAEEHNARIMAAAGVNAKVLYFDATDGTMLSEFVEGVSMTETSFGDEPDAPARVALALKRVHRLGPVFKSRFDVFAMIEVYLGMLRKLGAPLPEDYHEVAQGAEAVRRVLDATPMPLSPCHNDPWPANFLDAGGRLYIIDWEFSGMNDPMWDLGDLSVEAGFELEQDRVMMEAYYGAGVPLALYFYSRLALYKALSDLLWALWGLIQHANDNPRNDFLAYALGRFGRCKALMGSTEFGRHVNAAWVRRQDVPTLSQTSLGYLNDSSLR